MQCFLSPMLACLCHVKLAGILTVFWKLKQPCWLASVIIKAVLINYGKEANKYLQNTFLKVMDVKAISSSPVVVISCVFLCCYALYGRNHHVFITLIMFQEILKSTLL